ncbi:SDR family oxidoreductase [Alkaliphilus serpentinus]|uniref:NAD-dependent epimerase/dehydratase family protein n=1 Tax=Alkaliphilus serpentinus TaxID=1482731 RepID=A0A833HNI9_9FIRM|nr:NAD-dependent epimerase/dehydratase family protein [Alkaliphilus serpentinus]KAB3529710.1 NAD-dependent epimerase/dehydratase family protein [Alkaliphilus serpentinus]
MLLVTGITGHTGRYFLKELIAHKYEGPIRCIVRETSDTSMLDNSGLDIEKVYGDLNDKEFIRKVMSGIDSIMHIYNIHHSPMIVETAIENNVKRAILVHTTGIYSNFKYASQGYTIEKKVSELTSDPNCLTKVTIVRPTMIYGDLCDSNMSKFIKMIDKFRVMPVINGGRSLIQPVNARDLGKAFYTVLTSPEKTAGKAYDLSGEKPIQMIEVFKMISDNLNKKTTFVSVPLSFGVVLTQIAKVLTLGKIDYVERVQRMGEDRSYPHVEAKKDFNYRPMSFEEGIEIEVNQYLKK